MPVQQLNRQGRLYTYRDYLSWPDDERWELIDGVAYNMTPSPSRLHQDVARELLTRFNNYLKGKPCKVYAAPFDVRLPTENEKDDEAKTVVQPDLVVVCDPSKLDEKGCNGAPDLVVEILSPATAKKDMVLKFSRYEKAGIKEYWIISPENKTLMVFKIDPATGRYGRPEMYSDEDTVTVGLFADLTIDLKTVFES
jgi:Uma2 family endonuclease